jgi:CheY-like chemotaxis protein
MNVETAQILLVEDSPTDVELTREVLADAKVANELHCVTDGEAALRFLRREGEHAGAPRPDFVLLDVNLPRMSGLDVVAQIKEDPALHDIPVVMLTTSDDEADVLRAYKSHANSYITKPMDLDQFIAVVRSIEGYWLSIVRFPKGPG